MKAFVQKENLLTDAYRNYAKELVSYACYKVHNPTTSEDLVQDAFLKTWTYLKAGKEIHLMRAFLYHVLNNLIVDEYRKHKMISLDSLSEKGYEPSEDGSEHLIDMLDGKSAALLIQNLPERYQKVMHMRYVQDLSLSEMARLTGQSQNTLAVQLYRGLKKLKRLYNQDEAPQPNTKKTPVPSPLLISHKWMSRGILESL